MYRKPKFLEILHAVREQMARECAYDMDLFVQMIRQPHAATERSADETPSTPSPSSTSSRRAKARRRA